MFTAPPVATASSHRGAAQRPSPVRDSDTRFGRGSGPFVEVPQVCGPPATMFARPAQPPRGGQGGPQGADEPIDPERHASHRGARHGLLRYIANVNLLKVDEEPREDDSGDATEVGKWGMGPLSMDSRL